MIEKPADQPFLPAVADAAASLEQGRYLGQSLAQTRIAIQQAGDASEKIGNLAATTDGLLAEDVKPTIANLNRAIDSARASADALTTTIGAARPGLNTFSRQTIPEANRLVRDLRATDAALSSVAEKVDQQGAGSILGQPKLPDYEGK